MTKLCQSCFARPPLARTKKNPKYRIILNHDLCKECERRVWDQIRVIENLSENKIIQKSK